MLLANASDKNVTTIVEGVLGGNVLRYLKSIGSPLDDNILVYGVKASLDDKNDCLYIMLSRSLYDSCDLHDWKNNCCYLQQLINNKAKDLGINRIIRITTSDDFANAKGLDYTIGLPAILRSTHVKFCQMIVELLISSFTGSAEQPTMEEYLACAKVISGTYRPDLPEALQFDKHGGPDEHVLQVHPDAEEDEEDEDGEEDHN